MILTLRDSYTGGLHNRVMLRMPIDAFTLAETKSYLRYKNIHYNNDRIKWYQEYDI